MSNLETPPQTPPPASEAASTPAQHAVDAGADAANAASAPAPVVSAAPAAHASEGATGNGHPEGHAADLSAESSATENGDDGDSDADDAPTDEAHAAAPGAPAEGGAPGEKKRRRRRRRKKGAQAGAPGEAGAPGAPPVEGGATAEAPVEGATDESAEARPAENKGERKDRKKDKKAGPPRDRPPVNAGDIVFGKIVEITDEAILVDIPGKARAIFDRRELLIPEEEEAARRSLSPAPAPAQPAVEATGGEASVEGEARADEHAPEGEGQTPDGNVHVEGDAVASPSSEAAAPAVEEAAAGEGQPANEGDASSTSDEALQGAPAAAEKPAEAMVSEGAPVEAGIPAADEPTVMAREPKVPRVVLEVGADFIGVVHNDGARGGLVVLTHHPNRAEKAKPLAEKAMTDGTTIEGLVTGVIKGGIEVDVDGLRAFAPGSHVDLRLGADLSRLVARRLPFFVTQYAKRGRDVVLSRRAMLEDEARKSRTEALARLKVGDDFDGIVRSVVPFGAFVDVGGIEGLVPLQEMSHNRADGPSDVFKAGEPTRVRVIKIDDRGKVWLSRKATIADPWQQVAQRYATGSRHTGKIARLLAFGAFVELEPGVDGLIHTQDLSLKRIEAPGDVVKVGDAIDVVVAHIDPSQHKIGLHPAPQGDTANEAPQRVAQYKAVKAKIVNIESGGLVVRILGVTGRNARGYVTAAGTGTARGTELRKAFNIGQQIDAKVLEIDPRRGEVKLSIKALSEELERSAYQQYRQQVKAEARFTFGDLLAKKGTPQR